MNPLGIAAVVLIGALIGGITLVLALAAVAGLQDADEARGHARG